MAGGVRLTESQGLQLTEGLGSVSGYGDNDDGDEGGTTDREPRDN